MRPRKGTRVGADSRAGPGEAVPVGRDEEASRLLASVYDKRTIEPRDHWTSTEVVGISLHDARRQTIPRPWDDASRTLLWRLAAVRGWSPKAIALFTARRVESVEAELSRLGWHHGARAAPPWIATHRTAVHVHKAKAG